MLALHMGATRVGLIGVDFTDDHFFAATGRHPLAKQVVQIDKEYEKLAHASTDRGITILNLSSESRLTAFPKKPLQELVGGETPLTDTRLPTARNSERKDSGSRRGGRGDLCIVHVSLTNCAGALWNLHRLIENYSHATSRVITASTTTNGRTYPKDVLFSEKRAVRELLQEADVLHFHNMIDQDSPAMSPFRSIISKKPAVLQFHSEPQVLKKHFPGRPPQMRSDLPLLVVAQKQARFFPNAEPIPNAIDIHEPLLTPGPKRHDGVLRVLYTPTDAKSYPDYIGTCRGKGYSETSRILRDLQARGEIEAEIMMGMTWDALMSKRRAADVVIDECVTGGYHLTSLEGLSQGLVTLAFLDDTTQTLLRDLTGCSFDELPWLNTPINRLHETLSFLAHNPLVTGKLQRAGRSWMERFWSPEVIVRRYIDFYRRVVGCTLDSKSSCAKRPHQPRNATSCTASGPDRTPLADEVFYRLPGKSKPKRSDEYAQQVRLGRTLLSRRGELAGRPCHILGNGPSVMQFDFSAIRGRVIIGVNDTPLLRERIGRATDYYCVADRRFLMNTHSLNIAKSARNSVRVFAGYCCGFLPDADIHYVRIRGGNGVSDNLEEGLYHGFSVAFFAAQLALWLGCGDILLHGCEFDYHGGRFSTAHYKRPHDEGIYPQIAGNARMLAAKLRARGHRLYVVGPSRLVGGFGASAVAGVRRITIADLERKLKAGAEEHSKTSVTSV
jgi:hypothetical protein